MLESLVFNKLAHWPATFLKKRLRHRCFSEKFAKFLRTPLLTEHLWWLLLAFPDTVLRKEQNKNYSTNLTTTKCGLNENKIIDQW